MNKLKYELFLFTLILAVVLYAVVRPILSVQDQNCFPGNFKFGVASSAYQIEGGWNEDGKGLSIFDKFSNEHPELIADGSNGNIACDSYHKYEEDIKMLKNLGVDFYRFSISWSRILPKGLNYKINQAGVNYYLNLLRRLEEEGIEAYVTLFHWDLPQPLSYIGDWSNPFMVRFFSDYARVAFKLFGDKVNIWFTFNEPFYACQINTLILQGTNPQYPKGVYEYMCGYTILKAHAEVYHIYDKEFRYQFKSRISISLDTDWYEPFSNNVEDLLASERRLQYHFGWFASPLVYGNYPDLMIKRVAERSKIAGNFTQSRLPELTPSEQKRIKGSYDFLGVTSYTTYLVRLEPEASYEDPNFDRDIGVEKLQNDSWIKSPTASDRSIVPWGFRKLLNWIKNTYGNPEIFITENGFPDTDRLVDLARCHYYKEYLKELLKALNEDGLKISGYTAWSLMDNFEWHLGYMVRYGLYHVDFKSSKRTRTPRTSATCYKNITRFKCPDDCKF